MNIKIRVRQIIGPAACIMMHFGNGDMDNRRGKMYRRNGAMADHAAIEVSDSVRRLVQR